MDGLDSLARPWAGSGEKKRQSPGRPGPDRQWSRPLCAFHPVGSFGQEARSRLAPVNITSLPCCRCCSGSALRCDDCTPPRAVIPHSPRLDDGNTGRGQFPLPSRDAKNLPYELSPFPPLRSPSHHDTSHSRSRPPTVTNSRPQQLLSAVCAPYPVTRRVKAGRQPAPTPDPRPPSHSIDCSLR